MSIIQEICQERKEGRMPCLASIQVLAGLHEACVVCRTVLTKTRAQFGWARQMNSNYYLSDQITGGQRRFLLKEIRHEIKVLRVEQKTLPPAVATNPESAPLGGGGDQGVKATAGGEYPTELRVALHRIQRLILSAQTTINVEDYGDALAGAQSLLQAVINQADAGGKPS